MASGLKSTDKNHFEATYEHPWGGVSSEAYKTDIAPNQMEVCDGLIIKNGALNAAVIADTNFNLAALNSGTYIPITLAFTIKSFLYLLNFNGQLYFAQGDTPAYSFTPGLVNAACVGALVVKIINDIAYIFCYDAGKIFAFDPTAATFTQISSFVAGRYAMVLDEYLVTANTNQPTDTPAKKDNRVNWSSPDGFGIWDPSIDRSSGFNTISDVSDTISGLFAISNVGFVLRRQGLTQMTPTGIGIQPFDFTALWASDKGVGCLYPATLAQYGNVAIWGNDSGFYTYSLGGSPQEICKQAKSAIFRDIVTNSNATINDTNSPNIFGCIYNNTYSNIGAMISPTKITTPDLRYTLCLINRNEASINIIFWTYSFNQGTWTRQTLTIATGSSISFIYEYFSCQYIGSTFQGFNVPYFKQVPVLILTYQLADTTIHYRMISLYESSIRYDSGSPVPPSINGLFKAEQVKIGRRPNIRGVAVVAKGKAGTPQTLKISIQNELNVVHFTDIVVTDEKVRTYISNGMFTSESPQLNIQSDSFDGCIIKAMPYGTFADGELP